MCRALSVHGISDAQPPAVLAGRFTVALAKAPGKVEGVAKSQIPADLADGLAAHSQALACGLKDHILYILVNGSAGLLMEAPGQGGFRGKQGRRDLPDGNPRGQMGMDVVHGVFHQRCIRGHGFLQHAVLPQQTEGQTANLLFQQKHIFPAVSPVLPEHVIK